MADLPLLRKALSITCFLRIKVKGIIYLEILRDNINTHLASEVATVNERH